MSLIGRIRSRLGKLRRDEDGSIAVETLLMVPLLSWAMLSTLTYFDAYRAEAISHKAGLTIADMVSRETATITPDYINGTRGLLRFLTIDDNWPDLRITAFEWQESRNRYRRIWSQERGPRSALRTSDLANMTHRLPILSDGEVAILVETWSAYSPPYSVGLSDFEMETFTVISPRFATQICWDATPEDDAGLRC